MAKPPFGLVQSIHLAVNGRVDYTSDLAQYGTPEKWCEAHDKGDCEDYALAKRKELRAQGYGPYCHLATCWTETDVYHAVLIVETDDGPYVLDNRHTFPKMKQDLDYKWHKIEKNGSWYLLS